MNWAKGYSATYYMTVVDPVTWRDTDRIELADGTTERGRIELIDGTIKRQTNGLRASADLDCINWPDGIERWIRVYMDTEQEGEDAAHVALFTGLATSPGSDFNGNREDNGLECYSSLKPAEDIYLDRGWYAPAGVSGGVLIRQLLEVTPAPVSIAPNAPRLSSSIVAEDDETHLTMIDKILNAMNWRIRLGGDGSISIEPVANEPVASFDPVDNDIIEITVSVEKDLFACPNVFRAIDDDLTAVARDDSPNSPLSTVNRGREVWAQETSCDLADNETIEQYAARRLTELQKVGKTADYNRRFLPGVTTSDLVRLWYPEQGLDGVYYVNSQSIRLRGGARTSEQVQELI